MKRGIRLPSGRWVSVNTYLIAWRQLQTTAILNPDKLITGWDHFPTTAKEILRDMRYGLHDRINRHDRTRPPTWRKLDADWQRAMTHSAYMLNTPRLIIDWLPAELRHRFNHRLRTDQ